MSQIRGQWWHFLGQLVIVVFDDVSSQRYGEVIINDDHNVHHLLYGPHVPNLGAVVTLLKAIGYCGFWWSFITNLWSGHHKRWSQCSSSAIWTPCPKSGCSGDTFWGNWLLLFLMMFHHKDMARSSWIMITMFIICYRTPCAKSGCSGDTFGGNWLLLFLIMFHYKGMVRSS